MKAAIALENYGIKKLTQAFWKQFLSSVLAGIFISIAYTVAMFIICESQLSSDQTALQIISKVIGSILFSIAVIACCIFGASLFTGNCMGFISCMHKRVKWRYLGYDLLITFCGNFVGCFAAAILIAALPIFTGTDPVLGYTQLTEKFFLFASGKVTMVWWQTLIAAIFCNILVLGSVMAYVILENKAAAIMVIVLFIAVFVTCGFQHVVADMFVGCLWGFVTLFTNSDTGTIMTATDAGKFFYSCLLPATIGNVIGGAFLITIYYGINVHVFKHSKIDPVHIHYIDETTHDQYEINTDKANAYNEQFDKIENDFISKLDEYHKQLKQNHKELRNAQRQNDSKKVNILNQQANQIKKDIDTLKCKYKLEITNLKNNSHKNKTKK